MNMIIIENPDSETLNKQGVFSWPIWEKEISAFDWTYDSDEECYIIEGKVIITTPKGTYEISGGDFVTFKRGLKCHWNIVRSIKKHYNFPE
ncbi:MAG: cupin domain-containing protein [Bacteroidales bacterium]|nr:cupin domain-containing protein [Bacteroidales bacterium]